MAQVEKVDAEKDQEQQGADGEIGAAHGQP